MNPQHQSTFYDMKTVRTVSSGSNKAILYICEVILTSRLQLLTMTFLIIADQYTCKTTPRSAPICNTITEIRVTILGCQTWSCAQTECLYCLELNKKYVFANIILRNIRVVRVIRLNYKWSNDFN